LEILKGKVLQVVQVTDSKQFLMDLLGHLPLAAGADLQPTEIRMAYGQVTAHITQSMANWAIDITG